MVYYFWICSCFTEFY